MLDTFAEALMKTGGAARPDAGAPEAGSASDLEQRLLNGVVRVHRSELRPEFIEGWFY